MSYTLNKRRGQKHSGRGHRKHKSGSKGGTGRAGHRTHKNLAPVVYKKRSRYIKYAEIVSHWNVYVKKGILVEYNGEYVLFTHKLNAKLIEIPASAVRLEGSNHSKRHN